jgi:hypothetical protein
LAGATECTYGEAKEHPHPETTSTGRIITTKNLLLEDSLSCTEDTSTTTIMGRGRKTGYKLSEKHKQNISTVRKRTEQQRRSTNLNSFKRSLFAQVEAALEETENPSATPSSEEDEDKVYMPNFQFTFEITRRYLIGMNEPEFHLNKQRVHES